MKTTWGMMRMVKRLVYAKICSSGSKTSAKVELTPMVQTTLFSMFKNNKKKSASSNVCTATMKNEPAKMLTQHHPLKWLSSVSMNSVKRLVPTTLIFLFRIQSLLHMPISQLNPRMVCPKNQ